MLQTSSAVLLLISYLSNCTFLYISSSSIPSCACNICTTSGTRTTHFGSGSVRRGNRMNSKVLLKHRIYWQIKKRMITRLLPVINPRLQPWWCSVYAVFIIPQPSLTKKANSLRWLVLRQQMARDSWQQLIPAKSMTLYGLVASLLGSALFSICPLAYLKLSKTFNAVQLMGSPWLSSFLLRVVTWHMYLVFLSTLTPLAKQCWKRCLIYWEVLEHSVLMVLFFVNISSTAPTPTSCQRMKNKWINNDSPLSLSEPFSRRYLDENRQNQIRLWYQHRRRINLILMTSHWRIDWMYDAQNYKLDISITFHASSFDYLGLRGAIMQLADRCRSFQKYLQVFSGCNAKVIKITTRLPPPIIYMYEIKTPSFLFSVHGFRSPFPLKQVTIYHYRW